MNAFKKIAKQIQKNPDSEEARVFRDLINALDGDEPFQLGELYELPYDEFQLALAMLREWRLDRYTKSKGKLRQLASSGAEAAD